jgi:ubiquinol-cytochrome c reductase iron-sulfur subunit
MPDEHEDRGDHDLGHDHGHQDWAQGAATAAGSVESLSLDAPQFGIAAKHARRAEMVVAVAFIASLLGFAGFGAAYWVNARSEILGATLGLGMCAAGVALVAWGKYLMPRGPFVEERHRMVATKEERARFVGDFASRGKVAVERRSFLAKLMGAAIGVLSVVALFPLLRSLGPLPGNSLYITKWRKGIRVVTIDGNPVNVNELPVGSILTVFPEDDIGSAISQTLLIHADFQPVVTRPGRESWSPDGYLAYSKVCTHAGCPVSLYEKDTQQLLCPCHQSLFDIENGAEPVFGPAPRPLPQLPLGVDAEGYLIATDGYNEPIGPGFWERGND